MTEETIVKKKRGGAMPGAGRPKSVDGVRGQHQIRAYDDEWELIQRFARIVKHVDKEACARMLDELEK